MIGYADSGEIMQLTRTLQMIQVNGNIANRGIGYLGVVIIILKCIAIRATGNEICHELLPVKHKEQSRFPTLNPIITSNIFSFVSIRSSPMTE